MTADTPLTRESFWRLHPMGAPRPLPQLPNRVWTEQGWDRIRLEYRSPSMHAKQNVFAEGDVLFIHRSWTGHAHTEHTASIHPSCCTTFCAELTGSAGSGLEERQSLCIEVEFKPTGAVLAQLPPGLVADHDCLLPVGGPQHAHFEVGCHVVDGGQ